MMISLTVNNKLIEIDDADNKAAEKRLIDYLRDDLRLTSVKEGCREGACGTCMVLIGGKPVRACIMTLAKASGKNILTVEGLSKRELDVYNYAFTRCGAVQCGFCTPGMVISAKALLDENPDPSRADVKAAINANICRCTGYVKIIDAVIMAAEYLRGGISIPDPDTSNINKMNAHIGISAARIDASDKISGKGLYCDDMTVPDMVYAKALRSKYPRARVVAIEPARALKHKDCIAVITAQDIPGEIKCGHLIQDWDALIAIGETTRYIGDAIALVVSVSKDNLDEIASLVDVNYQELTPLTSPAMSLSDGAPAIHEGGNILSRQHIKHGDADAAIAKAAHTVSNRYTLPFTEHAFMEPECAVAVPERDETSGDVTGLTLYTGGQGVYDEQREVSRLLGVDKSRIRVRSMLAGGGFGGKEDMSVQHHAALAAWITKRPVKVKLSRSESIMVHPKRHAMEIDITAACDENGIITAVKAEIVADTGAYASLGGPVLQRACTHLGGPYNYQNADIKGMAVYTNNIPAGAFRGFGVPQSCFAMESNLNLLAEAAGISQWEIRYRNAIKPGDVLPNAQIADDSTALRECLLAVKDVFEASPYTGIACGFKNSGLGVGVKDTGRCIISICDGKIHIRSSAACIGQGIATVLLQIVCESLDIPAKYVVAEPPDTARTPDSGTTTASRQTLFSGEAAAIAARELLQDAAGAASRILSPKGIAAGNLPWDYILQKLDGCEYYGEYSPDTDPIGSDKQNPVSHVAYGYAAQAAVLDEHGALKEICAAYDIGTVINPIAAEGQIEGGVLMGIGYALSEDFPMLNGVPQAKYGSLGLIRAKGSPDIKVILINNNQAASSRPAYGAKGVGELATIPAAPAITGALYRFDKKLRVKLPAKE